MRVALVCHGLPPERRTGVETHAAELARALVRVGHDVVTIAPERDPDRPHLAVRQVGETGPGAVRGVRLNVVHAPRSTAERDAPPGLQGVLRELWGRERPSIVHVENAFGLGLDPFTSARAAGLPTIASAHDYAPVCHRVTLLRPDLERCTTVADPSACARCDAAGAVLDSIARLGDYQLGALPEQLEPDERAALALALASDDADRTVERRTFDRARRAAWNGCARILVPSLYLRDRCVEGGIDPDRLRAFEFGVQPGELSELPAPARAPGEPLRVLFVGGLSKHKGVHLLLAATERVEVEIELTIAGSSSDEPYRTELVQRARGLASNVRFSGAFDRAELPRLLADAHVVAVPSLWVENAPFVIREAFAARRPVLASRLGALPESVRDDQDGRLVEPTAEAWARALDELSRDTTELARLVAGIRPPRTIDDEARELTEIYAASRADRQPLASLPTSVQPFARELARLDERTEREVVERALVAVDRARRADGVSDEDFMALAAATLIAELGRLAGELRAAVREIGWLRETLRQTDEREAWRVRVERDVRAEARALRSELEHERERGSAHAAEAAWWRARAEAAEEEVRELRAAHAAERAEVEWRRADLEALRRERDWLRQTLDATEPERVWLRATLAAVEDERRWLETTLGRARAELDQRRAESASLAGELEVLCAHERWLRTELAALVPSDGALLEPHELPAIFARLAARLGREEPA